MAAIEVPQRTVALFSGPVAVAADGTVTVTLDLPDFAGELRLMAVAWAGNRIGAAAKPLTVRDPVVAEALLPRFLAPGDEARLPVLLHNLDLPAGEVSATLSAEGAIALAGPARLAATLAPGARVLPASACAPPGPGRACCGWPSPGRTGSARRAEARITVRSSRPVTTEVAAQEIPSGRRAALAARSGRWVAGTWRPRRVSAGRSATTAPECCGSWSSTLRLPGTVGLPAARLRPDAGLRRGRRGARRTAAARGRGGAGQAALRRQLRPLVGPGRAGAAGPAPMPPRRCCAPAPPAPPSPMPRWTRRCRRSPSRRRTSPPTPRRNSPRRPIGCMCCPWPPAAAGRGAPAAGTAGRPADPAVPGAARRRLRPGGDRPRAEKAFAAALAARRGRLGCTTTAARRGMRWPSRCC